MRIKAIIFAAIFFVGSSVSYAETMTFKGQVEPVTKAFESWTGGDHMGAAKRYEEEARLLEAEARGMEMFESKILPYLEVEAMKEAGVGQIIDRRMKEADEKRRLAKWHHNEALELYGAREAAMPHHETVQGVTQTSSGKKSYLKFDWIQNEDLEGW